MVQHIEGCYEVAERDPTDSLSYLKIINTHRIGWLLSGMATLVSCSISFYLIYKHSQYYYKPSQQRHIIRIILMVPIYAFISWLSYIFYREAPYYELIRDVYEAFVIASFFILLVNYVGDRPEEALQSKRDKPRTFPLPFCCLTMHPENYHFLQFLKYGIMQYVVLKPLITLIGIFLFANALYCPENYAFSNGHIYLSFINFVSVSVAMYALIIFYILMEQELKPYEPFKKFLCVKLVIFFSFWQSVLIGLVTHFGWVKSTSYWTKGNISTGIQALLICFEMIIFAVLHLHAFPFRVYRPDERIKVRNSFYGIVDALNPLDFFREIWYGAVYLWRYFIRKKEIPVKPEVSVSPVVVGVEEEVKEEEAEGKVLAADGTIISSGKGFSVYNGALSVDLHKLLRIRMGRKPPPSKLEHQ